VWYVGKPWVCGFWSQSSTRLSWSGDLREQRVVDPPWLLTRRTFHIFLQSWLQRAILSIAWTRRAHIQRIRYLPSDVDENDVGTRTLPSLKLYQSRKRKRHGRDDDDDMDGGRQKTPESLDKLANATTLYVGNL
jgi:hypothetical protein